MDYAAYVECFNRGDDTALVDRFYHEDVVFTGGSRLHQGKQALRDFLSWAHDGVREVIRLRHVLREGDILFADVDMDFHATKPRPDFPFGALLPGDSVTVRFFVTYRLRGDRICELNSMTWPAGWGVTKIPRLGGHPSQIAAFRAYAAAFSAGDAGRFPAFYQDDVVLTLRTMQIHGKRAIADFYAEMFKSVREELILHKVLADDEAIAAEVTSRFTALADAPDFSIEPMRRGDVLEVDLYVHYHLRDGLITSIHGVRSGEPRRVSVA